MQNSTYYLRRLLFCGLLCSLMACAPQTTDTKKSPNDQEITESITSSTGSQESVVEEPVVEEPVVEEPVVEEPVVEEPVVEEPVVEEPVVEEPVVEEPVVEKPVVENPVVEKPVVEKPVVKAPVVQHMSISGQITLNQENIRRQNAEVSKTVIYFQPAGDSKPQLPIKNHTIVTENKRFKPDVLAITRGSTVQFPVKDTILHNVFSVTPGNSFDLGLYSQGTTKNHVFKDSGIVYVHCNVHHSMQADVIVLDTPYFTYADSNGKYRLTDLPKTSGRLSFWHPRGEQISADINAANPVYQIDKTVQITRPKVPKHSNKFGKSYRPTRD